jgi:hypothetical protein
MELALLSVSEHMAGEYLGNTCEVLDKSDSVVCVRRTNCLFLCFTLEEMDFFPRCV